MLTPNRLKVLSELNFAGVKVQIAQLEINVLMVKFQFWMYKLFNVVRDLLKALIEGERNDPPVNLLFFEIFNTTISIHIAYNMYSS